MEELFLRKDLDHKPEALHRVEFYIIIFIEDGEGYHSIDFNDFQCSKGTLITIRKDQIHKFFKDNNLKGSLLLFTNDFLVSYLEKAEVQKTMLLFNELLGVAKLQLQDQDFSKVFQIIHRIKEEYFDVNDEHSMHIIRSELHILITNLFRIKANSENIDFEKKHLRKFVIFQQLAEENITKTTKVQDYASMMNISSKTLNTITKSIVHKSAKEFIDEICTKQIKRLLINTELSIKEIAYQSGFEETTNFYK
ncbi:AraC family transcriptional regulator [Flammeovirga agarivorans]|uniref:Helix-turn-helix domain-containing protein n=1 Tax=Flammeovirga agarivorans TaxID=2726742 RepID=A0A7X8SP25_9BACT|nr:helix-turn-helix transcriptional regulator [Flammeovirga agarivorans]NLR93786.1 helix-turn-helix domain-containing protein [Flammeovirga agarivorans]